MLSPRYRHGFQSTLVHGLWIQQGSHPERREQWIWWKERVEIQLDLTSWGLRLFDMNKWFSWRKAMYKLRKVSNNFMLKSMFGDLNTEMGLSGVKTSSRSPLCIIIKILLSTFWFQKCQSKNWIALISIFLTSWLCGDYKGKSRGDNP